MKKKAKPIVVKATEVHLVYNPLSSNLDAPQPSINISGDGAFARDDFFKALKKVSRADKKEDQSD